MTPLPLRLVAASLLVAGFYCPALADTNGSPPPPPLPNLFEPPVRLKADGQVIDTGPRWGHSSPAVTDLNGDGLPDLVIGDFGGNFHAYHNTGSRQSPVYKPAGPIQAGGVAAEVHIYCCIGAQARFRDLTGDGIPDLVANSYDPGHCYLFRGLPDHRFAAREELQDKSGTPVRSSPVQKQNYQSFGSFYDAVDYDDDGDLDLLIGCFGGDLKVRLNEGTRTQPRFATDNLDVQAAGQPLRVKAHLCPVVADWDGDGLWDVIAGSDDGSVTWFRNVGTRSAPAFAAPQTLVAPHDGHGYNRLVFSDADIVPGIRSQPEVFDYNGDGKLDLLVGDFYTAYNFRKDLTGQQKDQVRQLVSTAGDGGKEFAARMEALQKEFATRYPGDQIYSDEASKAWSKAYQALRESPESKRMQEAEKEFNAKLAPFLDLPAKPTGDQPPDPASAHGHVWLFIRK